MTTDVPTITADEQLVGPLVEPQSMNEPAALLTGRYVRLEHLERDAHFGAIWRAVKDEPSLWTYMLEGPFDSEEQFAGMMARKSTARDPYTFAIVDRTTNEALGYMALMRWDKAHRTVEVGHVMLSRRLQRTRAATEAFYLVMCEAFSSRVNCRRLEWKCNDLNGPSKRAAERLGFTYEGTFRQHYIVKGRSRDTAWFSIIDSEWTVRKRAFEAWLDEANFDEQKRQKSDLHSTQKRFANDAHRRTVDGLIEGIL